MAEKTMIEGELRVKEILRERGIKMYQLAQLIGITPESLTRALQRNPQYNTLRAIAEALNVPVRDLFAQPSEQKRSFIKGTVVIGNYVFDINNLDNLYDAVECAQREYERYGIPYSKIKR